jgi:hypothetical protein
MNSKAIRFDLDLNTLKPVKVNTVSVVAGTESGHFYNIAVESADVIVGFRNLNENYSKKTVDGDETRIRFIPLSAAGEQKVKGLADFFAMTLKTSADHLGNKGRHYSVVTTKSASILQALSMTLSV